MGNKTIIITGATDGIGLEAATKIAALGNQVGLVGRNPEKGIKAMESISSLTGNDKLNFFQAEDGIRDRSPSRGLGDVYKRQIPSVAPVIIIVLLLINPL